MLKPDHLFRRPYLVPALLVGAALLIWLGLMRDFHLDDSFITYRYARNLAAGHGLVYNLDETTLSTTAPLYAALLAALSFFVPGFHTLGGLVGALAIGAGGGLVYALLPRHLPHGIRAWAGLMYVLSSLLWLALGMETALWLALVLGAVWSAQTDRWPLAGLLTGLAVITRWDAVLPGALIGLAALAAAVNRISVRRRWWLPLSYAVTAALPVLLFAAWAQLTYGSPLPVTLGAKSAQAALGITGIGMDVDMWGGLWELLRSLFEQSPLYIAPLLLVVFGLSERIGGWMGLVAAWGALHLLAYIMLGVAPYRWYYAPLIPGAALLAANGLRYILSRMKARPVSAAPYVAGAVAALALAAPVMSLAAIGDVMGRGGRVDVMLPVVDWDAYRQAGEWLRQETPPGAVIGVAEVGQVGFYAERWMTDYLGLLQPEVSAGLRRGDLYSWLVGYAPDYLVFQRFRRASLALYNHYIGEDPWFTASYRPAAEFDDPRYHAGPVTIFERITPRRPADEWGAAHDFDGLWLVGLATDGHAIPPEGGTVRVRLDWQVSGALPPQLHIAVKGLDMAGEHRSFDGDYPTANWSGSFSTWHGFVVPSGAAPGRYPLLVAVGPTGGPYQEYRAGWLEVLSL